MKKKVLTFATCFLVTAGSFFSISVTQNQGIKMINESNAEALSKPTSKLPETKQPFESVCPDGITKLIVCGQGTSSCSPTRYCPAP